MTKGTIIFSYLNQQKNNLFRDNAAVKLIVCKAGMILVRYLKSTSYLSYIMTTACYVNGLYNYKQILLEV